MPSQWRPVRLQELVSGVTSGATPQSGSPRYYAEDGTPFAKIDDLTAAPGKYLGDTFLHVRPAALRETGLKVYPAGTLLLSMYGTVGQVKVTSRPSTANQALAALLPPFKCDQDFLYHLLDWLRPHWERFKSQTTQANINGTTVKNLEVCVPEIKQQRRIGRVLDTLDDQIAGAELVAEKLATIGNAILTRLLDDVQEKFCLPLGDYLAVPPKNGYSPVAASEPTGEYMLGLGCLTARGFMPRQLKHAPTGDVRLKPFLLSEGDVLMSRSNTRELVGHAGVFRDVGAPCYYPDLMMRLVPSKEISGEFLALVLNMQRVRRQVRNAASGTSGSMVKITKSTVEGLRLPIPPRSQQDRIVAIGHTATEALESELKRLAKLRLLKAGLASDLLSDHCSHDAGGMP